MKKQEIKEWIKDVDTDKQRITCLFEDRKKKIDLEINMKDIFKVLREEREKEILKLIKKKFVDEVYNEIKDKLIEEKQEVK